MDLEKDFAYLPENLKEFLRDFEANGINGYIWFKIDSLLRYASMEDLPAELQEIIRVAFEEDINWSEWVEDEYEDIYGLDYLSAPKKEVMKHWRNGRKR